ncbi:hypothetical protein EMCG_06123 [[Emmonsia] crescens]|uniref:Uncharacterized protein n=1 Tax=[Emmonsia] crescens TaxID=73230 RepID=A0A0G2IC90_9EURO|nr:hypothetical protein EMCG_06123 [Emmonsia crescens UAMH 3008]
MAGTQSLLAYLETEAPQRLLRQNTATRPSTTNTNDEYRDITQISTWPKFSWHSLMSILVLAKGRIDALVILRCRGSGTECLLTPVRLRSIARARAVDHFTGPLISRDVGRRQQLGTVVFDTNFSFLVSKIEGLTGYVYIPFLSC